MAVDKIIVIAVCITVLEGIALLTGIDGQIFCTVIGILAALGGYKYGQYRTKHAAVPASE